VIKTRVQTWDLASLDRATTTTTVSSAASQPLLGHEQHPANARPVRPSTLHIAREAYNSEGVAVFFRGLGVCNARAFIVNAVQWAVRSTIFSV